jgi:hypothetical protein
MNLLDAFREHLIANGVVRSPKSAAGKEAGLPPLFLEPKKGAPAPGDFDGKVEDGPVMLTAFRATGIPSAPFASWLNQDHVELRFRCAAAQAFDAIEALVRAQFVDRRNWMTSSGLLVVESGEYRRAQRLGGDAKSVSWSSEYWFQTYSGLGPRDGSS